MTEKTNQFSDALNITKVKLIKQIINQADLISYKTTFFNDIKCIQASIGKDPKLIIIGPEKEDDENIINANVSITLDNEPVSKLTNQQKGALFLYVRDITASDFQLTKLENMLKKMR